jgi:hypothetical protein
MRKILLCLILACGIAASWAIPNGLSLHNTSRLGLVGSGDGSGQQGPPAGVRITEELDRRLTEEGDVRINEEVLAIGNRVDENGNRRITEEGDNRVIE